MNRFEIKDDPISCRDRSPMRSATFHIISIYNLLVWKRIWKEINAPKRHTSQSIHHTMQNIKRKMHKTYIFFRTSLYFSHFSQSNITFCINIRHTAISFRQTSKWWKMDIALPVSRNRTISQFQSSNLRQDNESESWCWLLCGWIRGLLVRLWGWGRFHFVSNMRGSQRFKPK